jgi:O-antigen/teichoic acid export membrane protein
MVNTVDSVIISAFVGVAMLGKYSNYALIASVMAGTISLFFTPLVSVIGHLCAEGDREKIKRHFECFYFLNYVVKCTPCQGQFEFSGLHSAGYSEII